MIDYGCLTQKQLQALGIVTPEQVISATVLDTETLRRRYAQDPTQQALVDRVNGEVDICSTMIARPCAMQQIRLFKVGKPGRGERGKQVKAIRHKRIAAGAMGWKAQSLAETSAELTEIEAHPVLDYLRRPNPFYPGNSLEFMRFKFGSTHGNFYTILTDDGRGGKIGWPGYPQFMQPVFSDTDYISHFLYGRDSKSTVAIPAEQVIHWKNYILNKSNPLMGDGELAGVLVEADLTLATNLHDLAFTRQGCRPDAMISVNSPSPVTQDQLDSIYDNLEDWKQGGRREGMPYVGQFINWQPLTWTPKDMLTVEKVEAARKMIRRAFGIPESMADSNASTYASSLIADAQMGRVVWSKLVDDAAQKSEWLLPEFGLDPTVYVFAYDNPVPRDEQAESARLQAMVAGGTLKVNEFRQEMGYDESDDPMADRLLFNGVPLGSLGGFGGFGLPGATDQPEVTPGTDGQPVAAEAVQDTALNGAQIAQLVELARLVGTGEITRAGALAIAEAAFPAISPEKIGTIFTTLREGEIPPDADPDDTPPEGGTTPPDAPEAEEADDATKAAFQSGSDNESPVSLVKTAMEAESPWWSQDRCGCCSTGTKSPEFPSGILRELYEAVGGGLKSDLEAIIDDMQAEVLRAYGAGTAPDIDGLKDQAAKLLQDQVAEVARRSMEAEVTRLGATDDFFSVIPEKAIEFARSYTIQLVDDIAGTTAEIAGRAVEAGLREGLSMADIADQISGVPEQRAEMIARTEVSRAMNGSNYEAWRAMGASHIEWFLAPGACSLCQGIEARGPKPIGEPFALAGEIVGGKKVGRTVLYPPAHPNDRCSSGPLFPEDNE